MYKDGTLQILLKKKRELKKVIKEQNESSDKRFKHILGYD